jgi:ATP-dependent Lhr-like helicase
MDDGLTAFLPPVRAWFRSALGEPTQAQLQGWPAIRAGNNTLILAPTGSGKTLAAFLACLDELWRQRPLPQGVRVLYVSPLKALNNDIYRNLQIPLEGVLAQAHSLGEELPAIEVAVRTGDTPQPQRQRMIRKPPHALITTPESLHLLLTSGARECLRNVTHCIVDEIHAVCANKRGVFLALLLERLQALIPKGFVRIGLSATQRPLEEVARYLGGCEFDQDGALTPRPVTIVDAGVRKDLDLRVVNPVPQFGALPEKSVWPAIYRLLGEQVRQHRSTLIFANNRRTVERITAQLNAEASVARAHHGSVALEVRQQTEAALKEGRLPAVVATASLELGIDMGAVDLVCQVESPGTVARALQRVGRAGHIVGQKSKGRLIPKTPADLLEQTVLAREMACGNVEEIQVPSNCLDVLAQQVVAMVAVEPWHVTALLTLVRRAYPFRSLTPQAFENVLEMISGRFRWQTTENGAPRISALEPKVSWERIHNCLHALPGSKQLALVNGGTIPNTGQYAACTLDGVRVGELDEEFIYERRVGDAFLLGTNAWRIERIESDRVILTPAAAAAAMVPFWRGEKTGRSIGLGLAIGRFLRDLGARLESPDCQDWLEKCFHLDAAAARNLRTYVRRQLEVTGCLPTDDTVLIETCRDPLGDWQVLLLSPLGSRLHFTLRLALEAALHKRLGYRPQCLHHDDGILVRLTESDEPLDDLLAGLTSENVEELVLDELADSPLFALRFRQNAARALLLPRTRPGKRAPLWLQRLRGRDLLQVARKEPEFPIVAETFRECLHDHLDVPRLRQWLADVQSGRVQLKSRRAEAPSPFASGLLFAFTMAYMYQYDDVQSEPGPTTAPNRQLLEQLIAPERQAHLLDPRAILRVERRLRNLGRPPQSTAEMSEWLRRLGDLATDEVDDTMAGFLREMDARGVVTRLELPGSMQGPRWLLKEDEPLFKRAFSLEPCEPAEAQSAGEAILDRFLRSHALVGLGDLLGRYPFERDWAGRKLNEWAASGRIVAVSPEPQDEGPRWSLPDNLDQVQRGSLSLLRSEVVTCQPEQFADFLLRWQYLHPSARRTSPQGLYEVLDRLEGVSLPPELWQDVFLPARVLGFEPRWVDDSVSEGEWLWVCRGEEDMRSGSLGFWHRSSLAATRTPPEAASLQVDAETEQVWNSLKSHGASFLTDVATDTGLAPSAARAGLWKLARLGLITNDLFAVLRNGKEKMVPVAADPRHFAARPYSSRRRSAPRRPEGRWSVIRWGSPDPEAHLIQKAALLLKRFGIAARELAQMDSAFPSWRLLYEVLSRMEWTGEVRRGYFVAGLSGAQFASPEAMTMLQQVDLPCTVASRATLLHSLDPANLYGAGAPFGVALLGGASRAFPRRIGNWLVQKAGRPIMLIEQHGKRLTILPGLRSAEVGEAISCLPAILRSNEGHSRRHKLTVEEWNDEPIMKSAGQELLQQAGFVRDYQAMTLYASLN